MTTQNLQRKQEMISMRDDNKTLQEIGDLFGICRDRVRQIIGNTSNRTRGASKNRESIIGGTSKKGSEAEMLVSQKLSGYGIGHKLMGYHSVYDIQLDNGLRVEVKSSSCGKHKEIISPYYKFNTGAGYKGDYTDFIIFVLLDTKEIFVVPFSKVKSTSQVCFVWPKTIQRHHALDIGQYLNRFDFLTK